MNTVKKLHRSTTDKVIAGVCGGIGETYNVDPVLVRLIWVAISVLTALFPFIVVYIFAWIIMPKQITQ
jgi:phage shock protein C